jgi:hypothetical protein
VGGLSARNFGLVIAYVVPGFVALWGLSYLSGSLRLWLVGAQAGGPNVGSFLYVLLASVALGLTASAVRWAVLDTVHHMTGIAAPHWNDAKLHERLEAFEALVDNHFRYYQFYGHMLVAGTLAYAAWRLSPESASTPWGPTEAGFLFLVAVFAAGSRDALRRYYSRTATLLGTVERTDHHDERSQPRNDNAQELLEAGNEAADRGGEDGGQGGEHSAQ